MTVCCFVDQKDQSADHVVGESRTPYGLICDQESRGCVVWKYGDLPT